MFGDDLAKGIFVEFLKITKYRYVILVVCALQAHF